MVMFSFISHNEHARIIESTLHMLLRRATLHTTTFVIAPAKQNTFK